MDLIKQVLIRNQFLKLIHQTFEVVKRREGKGAEALKTMNDVLEMNAYNDEYQTDLIGENRRFKLIHSQQKLRIMELEKEIEKFNNMNEF